MLPVDVRELLNDQLAQIRQEGLTKEERFIDGPQGAWVVLDDGRRVLNMCANNYLGLSGHPQLLDAAKTCLDRWGFGMSSVRFICGTQCCIASLRRR